MFVSSYSTYIPKTSSDKSLKVNNEREKDTKSSFSSILLSTSKIGTKTLSSLPIDYVITNKTFGNKQQVEHQRLSLEHKDTRDSTNTKKLSEIFSKQNLLINAVSSYSSNTKMFSLRQKPQATINQTPTISTKQPLETQELQINNLRYTMVNTYRENDKYYQIIAS